MMSNEQHLNVIGLAGTYKELHAVLRQRWKESGHSQDKLNSIAGYADRYLGKLLQPKQLKHLHYSSWQTMLSILGLKIAILEDPQQAARISEKVKKCADVVACGQVSHARRDAGKP